VLGGWDRRTWGPDLTEALRAAMLVEPNERNRDLMMRVLDGT
jgi:hypothetical protein